MLTIRLAQIDALERAAEASFVARMSDHLRARFPGEARAMTEEELDRHTRTQIAGARRFHLVTERDIASYLNLGMLFGAGFIDQPEHRWMQDVLTDPEVPSPTERVRRLVSAVRARLKLEEDNARTMADEARGP